MSETGIRVNTQPFIDWVNEVKSRYPQMVRTMQSVARIIELQTIPYVPLDTTALEQSYDYVVKEASPFILLEVGFDAVDEKSGFHYAYYQHENRLNHPRRGIDHYLTVGIMDARFEFFELIEKDYLSLFHGGVISNSIGKNDSMSIIDLGDFD